jgi:hypothetical membrane protein
MIKRWPIGSLFGIAAVAVYVILGIISFLHYPDAYSPLHNALSELGATSQNPSGAIFYNLGGILCGILLIPFYIGLGKWNTGDRLLKILILVAQISGIVSSAGLAWSCFFPVGVNTSMHVLGAGTAFVASLPFWVCIAFVILRTPGAIRWMAYFGYLPLIGNTVLAFFPAGRTLIEWTSVGLFMFYVVMLSYNNRVIRLAANS